MRSQRYKKYMKKENQSNNPLLKIFVISFFGTLLVLTFFIKSFSPTVDTSIGDYQEQRYENDSDEINKAAVDNRLEQIQNEDQGRTFADLMSLADNSEQNRSSELEEASPIEPTATNFDSPKTNNTTEPEVYYKVYIGAYTSVEQANVARDIIQESGSGFTPMVKCLGSNNYTLQVGNFKNKQSAESMLQKVIQNHLPGRIVEGN